MTVVKQGFRVRAGHPAAIVSLLAFALCIPFQIMGYAGELHEPVVALALVFLPVLSALLMIVSILRFGQTALWFSAVAVFIGVLGFVFKLVIDPREQGFWHHLSAAVLYALIVGLWTLTVLFVIKTKWVLVILFLIPFVKHVVVNDLPVLLGKAAPVPASVWLKEGSMLSFMLALSFFALAFEKTDP